MVLLIGVISSTTVHEFTHKHNIKEIDQICVLGYERSDSIMNSGVGWVQADSYDNYEEGLPTTMGIIALIIIVSLLTFIFRDELYG